MRVLLCTITNRGFVCTWQLWRLPVLHENVTSSSMSDAYVYVVLLIERLYRYVFIESAVLLL